MSNNWLAEKFDTLLDQTVILSYNRLGYALRQGLWGDEALQVDMRGKVCLVTGANAGLGFETSLQLAQRGATVYMVARSEKRGEEAREQIIERSGNPNVHLELADLSRMAAVRDLAERVQQRENRLDVLINNAGVLLAERQTSDEGLEMTFAVNVLSGFLLTHLLLPLLKASRPARVIFVSSGGMYTRKLNPDDLQFEQETYNGVTAYAQSKRAQVILTEMFAERLKDSGVTVNSMHPGWVDTPGLRQSLSLFTKIMNVTLRSPEQGADTIVWLAVAPGLESESGKFWFDRRPRETHKSNSTKSTPEERQKLWDECVRLSGLTEQEIQTKDATYSNLE